MLLLIFSTPGVRGTVDANNTTVPVDTTERVRSGSSDVTSTIRQFEGS